MCEMFSCKNFMPSFILRHFNPYVSESCKPSPDTTVFLFGLIPTYDKGLILYTSFKNHN